MNLRDFTDKYATLHTDTTTNETYIKLPLDNLEELSCLQTSLLDSMVYLISTKDIDLNDEKFRNSIYWICKILLGSYPESELEGLSELVKSIR